MDERHYSIASVLVRPEIAPPRPAAGGDVRYNMNGEYPRSLPYIFKITSQCSGILYAVATRLKGSSDKLGGVVGRAAGPSKPLPPTFN